MAKKHIPKIKAEARAVAKVEATVKASFQRKKTITEVVPEDVTRAKAARWLDLISPITEWAALKGDALNFQRQLLRIQREETLLRVAESVQTKLVGDRISPVPRKILVPALEKASLEVADDDIMIDRWANLLASAAQEVKVQPRFVGVLEEMAGSQAQCLDYIAFNGYEKLSFPARDMEESSYEYADHNFSDQIEGLVRSFLSKHKDPDEAMDRIVNRLTRPGVFLELAMIHIPKDDEWYTYDSVSETKVRRESDLAVLESLGLVRRVVVSFDAEFKKTNITRLTVDIYYYHLTVFGVEFCEACSRPKVVELEKIDQASRERGIEYESPTL